MLEKEKFKLLTPRATSAGCSNELLVSIEQEEKSAISAPPSTAYIQSQSSLSVLSLSRSLVSVARTSREFQSYLNTEVVSHALKGHSKSLITLGSRPTAGRWQRRGCL